MPVKRPPNKADLRQELKRQIRHYLKHGGRVDEVPSGVSGREDDRPLRTVLFDSPRQPRTHLDKLAADIDRRRKPAKPQPRKKKAAGGHYKILYDDFGEPIRKIWVDDR